MRLRRPLGVCFRCCSLLLERYLGVLLLADNQSHMCDVTADASGLELGGLVALSQLMGSCFTERRALAAHAMGHRYATAACAMCNLSNASVRVS